MFLSSLHKCYKIKVLLPISWEKGVKDPRIQGAKGLFSNDLKQLFKLMVPILYSFNNET